jgi:trans-aconitate methyltransferase
MTNSLTRTIRGNYDRLAEEYARRLFGELQHKPLDRELLTRFAHRVGNGRLVCDLGCGPGHVTRFLNDLPNCGECR